MNAKNSNLASALMGLVLVVMILLLPTTAGTQTERNPYEVCKENGPKHPTDPCYITPINEGGLYGFNAGGGHGNGHDIALEWGDRYSVDRCSLAHDRHFWRNGLTKGTSKEGCSNDLGLYRCVQLVKPRPLDANERIAIEAATLLYRDSLSKACSGQDFAFAALPMALNRIYDRYAKPNRTAQYEGEKVQACPQLFPGSFWDPRNGGECWSCPSGYARTVFAVTAANACEKGGPFGQHQKATYKGKPRAVCPADMSEWSGGCYKCPAGYKKLAGFPRPILVIELPKKAPDKDPNACAVTNPDS